MLQAFGMARTPMVTMVVGGCLKVMSGYILLGRAEIGILGAPIGTGLCYAVAVLLNMAVIVHRMNEAPSILNLLIRPLFASLCSIGPAAFLYYRFLMDRMAKLGTLFCIGVAVGSYIAFSLLTGAVKREELMHLLGKEKRNAPKKESGV
jgi:stage V sporulation protein B